MNMTVQEVEDALGLPRGDVRLRPNYSTCTYNPYPEDDPGRDCHQPGRWHIKMRSEKSEQYPDGWASFITCDAHLGRVLGGPFSGAVVDRHEFGSACGLVGSWWIPLPDETGSLCVTEERGVELGYLQYEQDRPDGDLLAS